MTKFNFERRFKTEDEAKAFAEEIKNGEIGYMTNVETGEIVWYVDYNE